MVYHAISDHVPLRVTLFDQEPEAASQLFKWLDGNNTSGPEPCCVLMPDIRLSFVGFIQIKSSREGMLAGQQHYSL